MPTSTTSTKTHKPRKPLALAGLLLTPRDRRLLTSVYRYRQLRRREIELLIFPTLARQLGCWSSRLPARRLGLLMTHGFLVARRLPQEQLGGRPPAVYSIGTEAVSVISRDLNVPLADVLRRQRQDARLTWFSYHHRAAVTAVRLALETACAQAGYELAWTADEELAALKEGVRIDGKAAPIRPDGYLVLTVPRVDGRVRRFPCFVEVQRLSQPIQYARKLAAYQLYLQTGGFTRRFGPPACRVLAITDSHPRAEHLRAVAEPGYPFSWSTSLSALQRDPFGPIWLVAGGGNKWLGLLS